MTTLISNADGNLTGAATFALTETGATSLNLVRNSIVNLGAATTGTSATFTVTNTDVIDGVLLWVRSDSASPTGTLKVDLQKGGVSQASVTVNKADLQTSVLPDGQVGPVFFKFTSTATGDGGSNWTIVMTTTGTGTVGTWCSSGSIANMTRALRRTTAATPAATNDLFIVGELTGAGAITRRVVTMDSTATTAYGSGVVNTSSVYGGGVHIGFYGTLAYGSTASTNYVLRVNGDVIVYQFGELDICQTSTVTMTIAAPGVITLNSHGFEANRPVRLRTTGALPTGFAENTDYYVVAATITTNTFELSATSGGTSITTTGSQSGTHTVLTGMPRSSTAVLEFQQGSSGDFGLILRERSVSYIAGLSRTSGKNVTRCKLTTDVTNATIGAGQAVLNGTNGTFALDATGLDSLMALYFTDNVTNGVHTWYTTNSSVAGNATVTATAWIKRGTGTNNRYVRFEVGNSATLSSITNGFYSDIDLQLGTAGTVTAVGNGTATSVSITAVGDGFMIRMVGKPSSSSGTPFLHIAACNAAGVTSYVGDTTTNFAANNFFLTAGTGTDTTYNVDADTGWLSGDAVCIPSTNRGAAATCYAETTVFPLNANAGASSFVSSLAPFDGNVVYYANTYAGTAPYLQAELGLLTRNVKIRSTSATLLTYIYMTQFSTVTMMWTQTYWMGVNVTNKQGITIDSTTSGTANPKIISYCSMHHYNTNGGLIITNSGGVSWNLTFTDNVCYWISGFNIGSVTDTSFVISRNILYRTYGSSAVFMSNVKGTISGNTLAATANGGAAFMFNVAGIIGTFDDNTAMACQYGVRMNAPPFGTINRFRAWRANNAGFQCENTFIDITLNDIILFGSATNLNCADYGIVRVGGTLNRIGGDTTYASTNGINWSPFALTMEIQNLDTTASGVIIPPNTQDFNFNSNVPMLVRLTTTNCKFGATNLFNTATKTTPLWTRSSFATFGKFGQVAGDHRTELLYGQLKSDTSIFNSASPSMRMTPNNATYKLESAPNYKGMGVQVAVDSGAAVTVSVYVRKETTYNGNQPRLIQRANGDIGVALDTVLATYSAGTGSWNVLTATTAAATDDGVMEFVVDCDGTAGYINIDDWTFA